MAVTVYKSGSQIITKYGDINADFPANGKHIADNTNISIYNPLGNAQPVIVTITYDSPAAIESASAVWLTYQTIAADNNANIVFEYGPVGVKITSAGSSAVAWIKS
jgi:hypothetical protein